MKPVITTLIPYPVKVNELSFITGDNNNIIKHSNRQSRMVVACGYYSLN